jgi:hypothetical protein
MGASAATVVILLKEKHIVEAFRGAGATSAPAAAIPATLGVHERVDFSKLRRRGVLRETAPGHFYLDQERWEALRGLRHRAALVLALLVLALALIGLARSGAL